MPTKTKPQTGFAFTPAAAPPKRTGAGRPANPAILALIESLEELPLADRENRDDGWFEYQVPDVSSFRKALATAGTKMGVSFQSHTDVEVTADETDNPGVVTFRKVKRSTRQRKAKGE